MSKDISELNMGDEPYFFDSFIIDSEVKNNLIGNYALLSFDEEEIYIVKYVGRGDIKTRLKDHLEEYFDISCFMFSYKDNEEDAILEECRLYHEFKPEYNDIHPAVPKNMECPYCD